MSLGAKESDSWSSSMLAFHLIIKHSIGTYLLMEFHGENDADPAGHYCQQTQEGNHNVQRPLKICLLIYLIDIY